MAWSDNDLEKREAFFGGLSLMVFTLITFIVWGIDYPSIGNLEDEDDLITLHNRISNQKYRILAVSGVLLIILPLPLIHTYYMKRLFETILSFAFFDYYRWFYTFAMLVGTIIVCVLVPTTLIVAGYYSYVVVIYLICIQSLAKCFFI